MTSWGRHGSGAVRRAGLALLVLLVLAPGCASLRGAQAYREGNEALERGDSARAVVAFERAAGLLPGQSEIHNHLGLALAQAGRLDEAVVEFERATQLDCDNRAAEVNLVLAEEQRRQLAAESSGAGTRTETPE